MLHEFLALAVPGHVTLSFNRMVFHGKGSRLLRKKRDLNKQDWGKGVACSCGVYVHLFSSLPFYVL